MTAVRVETAAEVMTVTLTDVENRNALGASVVNGLYDRQERRRRADELLERVGLDSS